MQTDSNRVRSTTVRFRVTEEEKQQLQEMMKRAGAPNMDQYLRDRVLNESITNADDPAIRAFFVEVLHFCENTTEFASDICAQIRTALGEAKALEQHGTAFLEPLRKIAEQA